MKAYDNDVRQIAVSGRKNHDFPIYTGYCKDGVFHCSVLIRFAEAGITGYWRQNVECYLNFSAMLNFGQSC